MYYKKDDITPSYQLIQRAYIILHVGVRAFSDVTVSSPSNFSCTNTCTGFVSHQYCAFSVGDVTADISTGTQVQRDLLVCKTLNVSAYALRDDRTVIATELSQIYGKYDRVSSIS